MKKVFVFVILALLSLGLVSAATYYGFDDGYTYKDKIVETKYYTGEHRTYSRTTYINYDNDKRYSTDEYKYGYSYRATVDYRDKYYPVKDYHEDYDHYYKKDYYHDYRDYSWKYRDHEYYRRDSKDYYYEYVPHLREYQKKECYSSPPEGKLFYIKCP